MTSRVIEALPEEDYFSRPELSASIAKQLAKPGGPAKWRWEQDHPREAKRQFDIGHAAHKLVLGIGAPIVPVPLDICAKNGAWSTTEAKDFVEKVRGEGGIPLKPADAQTVVDMADALTRHSYAMELLRAEGTRYELTGVATDPASGVAMRCRWDAISPTGVVDYKTTTDAETSAFLRDCANYGYHLQAAHYRTMAHLCGITDATAPFHFIAQEKAGPYLVNVVELDAESLALGERQMRRAIQIWDEATALDEWPGYPVNKTPVSLPLWAFSEPTEGEAA